MVTYQKPHSVPLLYVLYWTNTDCLDRNPLRSVDSVRICMFMSPCSSSVYCMSDTYRMKFVFVCSLHIFGQRLKELSQHIHGDTWL